MQYYLRVKTQSVFSSNVHQKGKHTDCYTAQKRQKCYKKILNLTKTRVCANKDCIEKFTIQKFILLRGQGSLQVLAWPFCLIYRFLPFPKLFWVHHSADSKHNETILGQVAYFFVKNNWHIKNQDMQVLRKYISFILQGK